MERVAFPPAGLFHLGALFWLRAPGPATWLPTWCSCLCLVMTSYTPPTGSRQPQGKRQTASSREKLEQRMCFLTPMKNKHKTMSAPTYVISGKDDLRHFCIEGR
ncbi:uncharacterized protein LOC144587128 [Pogona vitticeps]